MAGTKTKAVSTGYNLEEVQKIRGLVEGLLKGYFPKLSQAPNILYVVMATLGFESGWRLLHKRGSIISSMHYFYTGSTGGAAGEYRRSPLIQNLLRSPSVTPQIVDNINQGCVAHGLSATMGYYYVKGVPANKQRFGGYRSLVDSLGMEVAPGESITALFAANDDLAKKRSIASGLIIMETDYSRFLSKGNSPSTAISKAIGSYLGAPGVADKNGSTPEMRINQVLGGKQGVTFALQQAGISKDGVAFANNSQAIPTSDNTSNSSNRTASTSAEPKKSPGCPTVG